MFLLLVFIYLKSGLIEVHHSITYQEKACYESLPLFKDLYRRGKFEDGPAPELIQDIKVRCEPVEQIASK
jgi:hypothetical protein